MVSELAYEAKIINPDTGKIVIEVTITVDKVPQLIADLVKHGVEVYRCTMNEISLEDVFVDAVDKNKKVEGLNV